VTREGAARDVPSAATKLALVDALAAWLVAVLGGGEADLGVQAAAAVRADGEGGVVGLGDG
jgi:hypothetical protein